MQNLLPIDPFLPEISQVLAAAENVVLVAEPGSGKTTRVAVNLINDDWLKGKKILMLEPRRLAAKAAATFISRALGEKVGTQVGYRIRGDVKRSNETRLEVITEGILTRTIQDDPGLEDVGLVIFDEFHERSIHADLSLALVLDSKKILRPDLRIMVMSATIDSLSVSKLLGSAKVINCPGRSHAVNIHYGKPLVKRHSENLVADTIQRAHKMHEGDILAFLPGRAEIKKVSDKLREFELSKLTQILSLHSDVPKEEQDRVLSPPSDGPRRIILSTNVAETSVTIPGVRIVVDSGLVRVPNFNPKRGTSGLETLSVSQASATQRAGRAGREAPGVCYRLWSEEEQKHFAPFNQAEILYADLSPFVLELSALNRLAAF